MTSKLPIELQAVVYKCQAALAEEGIAPPQAYVIARNLHPDAKEAKIISAYTKLYKATQQSILSKAAATPTKAAPRRVPPRNAW